MRLFTGVFPPDDAQREIHAAVRAAAWAGTRWIPAENLHLTLVFLGEVDGPRVEELGAALRSAAMAVAPPEVELGGLGGFPSLRRPQVLFLDCRRGAESLRALHRALLGALREDLRPGDDRPFHPHLTLTRLKRRVPVTAIDALAAELTARSWSFRASELRLVRSRTLPDGAEYESLLEVSLGG